MGSRSWAVSRVHSAAEHCTVSEVLLLLGDTQVDLNIHNKCLEILNYLNFKKSVLHVLLPWKTAYGHKASSFRSRHPLPFFWFFGSLS